MATSLYLSACTAVCLSLTCLSLCSQITPAPSCLNLLCTLVQLTPPSGSGFAKQTENCSTTWGWGVMTSAINKTFESVDIFQYSLMMLVPIGLITKHHANLSLSSQYNLMMLGLLAFEVTVYRHQQLYRLRHKKVPPPTRTLFPDITRRQLDDNVLSCLKYFLNYFFYKFGLEVRRSCCHSNNLTCYWFWIKTFPCSPSDLLPVGRKCDWSADGSVCRSPCLWPHHCPITSQQEVHCLSVAKILLLPVWVVVFPVPSVYRFPSCCLFRYKLTWRQSVGIINFTKSLIQRFILKWWRKC